MRNKTGRKLAAGAVVFATSGLTSCHDNGAVDPPPPPIECPKVNEGQTLSVTGVLNQTTLTVTIQNQAPATWASVQVVDPTGVTIVAVSPDGVRLDLTLELESAATTTGSFTVQGEIEGSDGTRCAVSRRFTFNITDGTVVIAARDAGRLPLDSRDQATIVLARRDGYRVELEGRTSFQGPHAFHWTVTSGSIVTRSDDHLCWELPKDPGMYQVELVIDYGPDGLAIDTMTFEVS